MVCNDLGLIVKGIFRIYYHDPQTEQDKNVFFFSERQFVVCSEASYHAIPVIII